MASHEHEYDVALSFAGEDRPVAEELALVLKAQGIRVFYDLWEQAKLWGEDLYEYLAGVYGERAQFCVMFISKHYAEKLWTTHERKMAQGKAFREKKAYILPVRLDSTEIPGIPETIGYLDLTSGQVSLSDAADLVLRKLGRTSTRSDVDPVAYVRSAVSRVLQLDEDNLYYHHGRYDAERWQIHRDVLRNTKDTISKFGEEIVPELTSILDSTTNRFLKRNILQILESVGSRRATNSVCGAARHPDAKVRNLAMLTLQKLRDESAIPTLRSALRDYDRYVRRNAVVAMKSLASETVVDDLIDVVRTERDPFVQAHAVEGLGAIGTVRCMVSAQQNHC